MGALHNKQWELAARTYVLEGTTKTAAYVKGFPKAKSFSYDTQRVRACELFKRERVKVRVQELQEIKTELAKKEFEIDSAYVLRRLVELDRMDIADILDGEDRVRPVSEWPQVWRQFISKFDVEEIFAGRGDERLSMGLLKKISWPDKLRVLEVMGKHVDVNAFKDTVDHRSGDGSMTPPTKIEIVAGEPSKS